MWFAATLNAFDALDKVHVSVVLRERGDEPTDRVMTLYQASATVDGCGETDPRLWLRDALVAMLEAL